MITKKKKKKICTFICKYNLKSSYIHKNKIKLNCKKMKTKNIYYTSFSNYSFLVHFIKLENISSIKFTTNFYFILIIL